MKLDKFYIPQSLDEPDILFYCTMGELGMFGLALMLGLFLKSFIFGLIAGVLMIFLSKKVKSRFGASQIMLLLYWNLPESIYGFSGFPPSYKRFFIA